MISQNARNNIVSFTTQASKDKVMVNQAVSLLEKLLDLVNLPIDIWQVAACNVFNEDLD